MKKKSAQSQATSNKKSTPSIISLVGVAGVILSMILALITFMMPLSGPGDDAPIVVFAGEYTNFPSKSMTNTIHASGFQIDVQGESISLDDDRYIIVGVGDNSFDYVNEYRDNPQVMGFVLVCPAFPDGSHVSGMNSQIPAQDIAIFAGRDDAGSVASIGDARLIYERLSGDDTVYGTPIKRGGMFASRCYVNNGQNRWLSLSDFEITSGEVMLFNPLFQNELAGYLSTSYGNNRETSYTRINSWYVMLFVSVVLALVSFCIYLAGVSVNAKGKKLSGKMTALLIAFSLCLTAAITFGCFIPRLSQTVIEITPFISVVIFSIAMIIAGIYMVLDKEDTKSKAVVVKRASSRNALLRDLFMAGAPLILVCEVMAAIGDIGSDSMGLIMAMSILDIVACSVVSIYGGSFKVITVILSMLLPFVVVDVGVVTSNNLLMNYALVAFISSVVAFVTSWPSSRHGSNPVLSGVTHGLTVLLVIATLL